MPQYHIRKNISLKKKNHFNGIVNLLILLLAIPVVIISALSLALYFLFIWLFSSFKKNKSSSNPDEQYQYEIALVSNEQVKIILVEEETDIELSRLNELWVENVYNDKTCLYRARTIPVIPELEGRILCFYLKEKPEGVILQALKTTSDEGNPLNTQLLFLHYETLKPEVLDETGDYYLYNDDKDANLILGFNKKEKIRLEVMRNQV